MKCLGIIIDNRLQFKDHYDYMKKIDKKISFLNIVSAYTRCIMYKSIIAPHFEYRATLIISMDETQLCYKKRKTGL